jgi:LemA protein
MNIGEVAIIIVVAVLLFAGFIGLWLIGTYNSLVNTDTNVENMWARVQTAYQRRADLIPNLVDTVKAAKNFEHDTQTEIAEMRSQAGQAKIDMNNAKNVEELQAANSQLSSVLARLMVVVEAYPDLKSNANFLALQDEISGTENRVKYERDEYNNAVRSYKLSTRSFPTNILAGMFGFSTDKWNMFEADKGAENAPDVGVEFGDEKSNN